MPWLSFMTIPFCVSFSMSVPLSAGWCQHTDSRVEKTCGQRRLWCGSDEVRVWMICLSTGCGNFLFSCFRNGWNDRDDPLASERECFVGPARRRNNV